MIDHNTLLNDRGHSATIGDVPFDGHDYPARKYSRHLQRRLPDLTE